MHIALVDLGVMENFLNGLEGAAEEVLAKLFNTSIGDGHVEVDILIQSQSQWRFGWQLLQKIWYA